MRLFFHKNIPDTYDLTGIRDIFFTIDAFSKTFSDIPQASPVLHHSPEDMAQTQKMRVSVFYFAENPQFHVPSLLPSEPFQNGSCNFSGNRCGLSPAMPVQAHKAAPDFPDLHKPQMVLFCTVSIQIFRKKQTDLIQTLSYKTIPLMRPSACTLSSGTVLSPAVLCNFFCCSVLHLHKWPDRPRHCPRQDRHATDLLRLLQHVPLQNPLQERCHAADQKNVQSGMSRYSMLYTRNPFLLSSAQKYLLNSLFPRSSPPPWTLIITGSICASFPFGRYLSRRCALFLSFAYAISVSKITPCGKWYFLFSLHTGFFKIISLF